MKSSLILSLVLLLAVPAIGASPDKEIVTVNGVPIRQSEVMERLWGLYGMPTLNQMVDELILRQEAKKENIKARAKEVDGRLAQLRSQFETTEAFKTHLSQLGTSMEALKADMAEQIVREKLIVKKHDLKVKNQEIKDAFEKFKPRLGSPPAVHLRHILVKTRGEADQIVERLKAGADFKGLAQEHSLALSGRLAGGDYGFVRRGLLPKDIEDVAFAMKVKETRVISSRRGHHVLQVRGRRAAIAAKFKNVKKDLKRLLLTEKINSVLPSYLQKLREKADIRPKGSSLR